MRELDLSLRLPHEGDADVLYHYLEYSSVTDMLLWDGPESLESFREGLSLRATQTRSGESHFFIIDVDGEPVGSIDIRPEGHKASVGLWVAESEHGRGIGTRAVREIVSYGDGLGLVRLEACVFVGNWASRKIFEKNGFEIEGTLRKYVQKGDGFCDEWILSRIRAE